MELAHLMSNVLYVSNWASLFLFFIAVPSKEILSSTESLQNLEYVIKHAPSIMEAFLLVFADPDMVGFTNNDVFYTIDTVSK